MHILLLNPPGHQAYIRDYYCSKVSKTNYLFPPVDLLILSGILAQDHYVSVVDAIADHQSADDVIRTFDSLKPDAVISLVGAVALADDLRFLAELALLGGRIIVSGDAFLENPYSWLDRHSFIDAVVLDFSSDDILAYLEGRTHDAASIVSRATTPAHQYLRPKGIEFNLPIPRHELFASPHYNFPFVRHKPFATVLTDYGCPFPCTFCIMATLGYRYRSVENVMEELCYLKELGRKEIFFNDQTFGSIRTRALELCSRMCEEGFGFGWVCFSRVDLADREMLLAMREAGCHTIIFGVESASEVVLKAYRKGYTKPQIREAFALCRELGIRTVATFILGLPEETRETAQETIDFLKDLQCDFASFNIAVPRAGTQLREDAIRLGLANLDTTVMDQSGSRVVMPSQHLTISEIMALKSRLIREFYLRPSYLLRRLLSIRSWYELKEQIREGYCLLRDH